jgi:hypothetical protein
MASYTLILVSMGISWCTPSNADLSKYAYWAFLSLTFVSVGGDMKCQKLGNDMQHPHGIAL